LGDELFEKLYPKARHAAVSAEYCWLDANAPDPSRIVAGLATAFEHQLREAIFERFCGALLAKGIRDYPERAGAAPVPVGKAPPSLRPRPGVPVQGGSGMPKVTALLENGRMIRSLTLGTMQKLLKRPLPNFTDFLAADGIHIQELMGVLPEITETRNRAVHEGHPSLREEASHIRRRWLGKTEDFPNIFRILTPNNSSGVRP
jgi:hypothetical protein